MTDQFFINPSYFVNPGSQYNPNPPLKLSRKPTICHTQHTKSLDLTPTTLRPDKMLETIQTSSAQSLRNRVLLFVILLTLEGLVLAQLRHSWLSLQQPAAAPIVFAASLAFFGRRRLRAAQLAAEPINRRFATLHAFAFTLLATISLTLLHSPHPPKAAIALWFLCLVLFVPSLVCALFAPRRLAQALTNLGPAWPYAALSTMLVMTGRTLARLAWDAPDSPLGHTLASITFHGVRAVLTRFYPSVIADPTRNILGTPGFQVEIAGVCSGMEGLALILVLTVGWLLYARHELRLARAVWLVPVALGLMGLLNVLRIAALIAIGASGHPDVAVTGFHAEAGWILFNLVAFGFLLTVQRLSWVRKPCPRVGQSLRTSPSLESNTAAVYLLPFLAIVAASLLTQATSSGFEWLYPLRFLAAAVVLWHFRASYRFMDWRFSWLGPAAGLLVFALWLVLHRIPTGPNVLASGLADLSTTQRVAWLAIRVLAAVFTVPLAEELAFRGYLARRLMQPDAEVVPFHALTLPAILLSSAAFGLMHGRMAAPGFVAGLIFALVAKRRGSLGEALAAHVTANLFLALWVLGRGDYSLW